MFGNLYLTESARGQFSAEDEQFALALAATAAAAIDRARLYQAARTRGEWLQATAAVTQRLLSSPTAEPPGQPGEHDGPLQVIAERARELARADLVSIVLPTAAGGSCGWSVRSGRARGPARRHPLG